MNALISQKNVLTGIVRLVLAVLVLLIAQTAAKAQAYTPQEQTCYNMVQGKVAWNPEGATGWGEGNIRNLCIGTQDPAATVGCFKARMPQVGWSEATKQCVAQTRAGEGQPTGGPTTTKFPGKASDIDAKKGSVWSIGNTPAPGGYEIFRLEGSTWTRVDGGAVRIAVDETGHPWVINNEGTIFRRTGDSWTAIKGPNGAKPIDIAISSGGEVWIVQDNDTVALWTGSGWTNLITISYPRSVTYVPQKDIFQIRDSGGTFHVRQSATSWIRSSDATGLAARFNDFAVDTDGTGWGLDQQLNIYRVTPSGATIATLMPPITLPTIGQPTGTTNTPITRPAQTPIPGTPSAPTNGGSPDLPPGPAMFVDVEDEFLPNATRTITTWNKAGYMISTRVYKWDQPTKPVFYANDGSRNYLAGESPKLTVGPEVPMNVPLQVRIYTVVGIAEAVESYRGKIAANIETGCFSARGTTMKPIVEVCPEAAAIESRHITFANEAGFTSEMFLDYSINQDSGGVPIVASKTVSTGLTALGYRRKIYVPEDALPNMPVTLRIKAYGTNKQDLLSQSFDLTRKESPCFMVKGLLLNPSSETCTGDDAFLTDEKRAEYEKYENEPSVLSHDDMQLVMNWIAAKMTAQMSPFCWKPIIANGAGYPLDSCGPGKEKEGVLCYPKCRDGYAGNLDRCGQTCPTGFTDIGFFCQKPGPYGRGGGHAWIWGDPAFDYSKAKGRCEKENPQGCESDTTGSIWYPKCKPGFHAVGTNICSPDCPSGWGDTGTGCTKPTYYRGAGESLGCGAGYEQSGGLCYPACKKGYQAVATNCTLKCPSQQSWDCGAACSTDQLTCGLTVTNQVVSPILAIISIYTLGTADVAAAPAKDAGIGAEQAAIQAVKGTSKLKNAYQGVKVAIKTKWPSLAKAFNKVDNELFTLKPGLISSLGGDANYRKLFGLRKGLVSAIGGEAEFTKIFGVGSKDYINDIEKTLKLTKMAGKLMWDIKKEKDTYNMLFADNFKTMTSEDIDKMIDQKFPDPVGRYQVKKQWALQNLDMLLTATAWNQIQTAVDIGGIIDPTGLTSVVGSYLHPMCGEDVPFPTQIKRLHTR